ncbi:MAG: hypothetical protein RIR00_677 [Pseudomonadota bacterium]|jgi:hypothetical protein
MGQHTPLFSVSVRHDYFPDGRCPDLEFVPTAATRRLLARSELLLRPQTQGIVVLHDSERAAYLPDALCCDFRLEPRNPDFLCYTDAPFCPGAASLLFAGEHAQPDGRLSREDYVGPADQVDSAALPADFREWGRLPPLLALQLQPTAGNAGQSYHLAFRSRRTYWLYLISGRDVRGDELFVAEAGREAEFDYLGETRLENGRAACQFRSRQPLPLQSRPARLFSLRQRSNGRVVLPALPLPAPGVFQPPGNGEGEALTSQIFVNL